MDIADSVLDLIGETPMVRLRQVVGDLACPVVANEPEFIGPAAIALGHRYNLDSRDEGDRERLDIFRGEGTVFSCSYANECSQVCPKNVDPAAAVNQAKFGAVIEPPSIRVGNPRMPTSPPQVRRPTRGPSSNLRNIQGSMSPPEPAVSSISITFGPSMAPSGWSGSRSTRWFG